VLTARRTLVERSGHWRDSGDLIGHRAGQQCREPATVGLAGGVGPADTTTSPAQVPHPWSPLEHLAERPGKSKGQGEPPAATCPIPTAAHDPWTARKFRGSVHYTRPQHNGLISYRIFAAVT